MAIDTTTPVTGSDDKDGRGTMGPARVRVAPGRVGPRPWGTVGKILPGKTRTHGNRLPMWEQTPDSVADVVRYTRAGGWIPGDWPWWVEAPGRAYGYVVAVPVTALAHLAVWTIQRPTRLFGIVLLAVLLRWAS